MDQTPELSVARQPQDTSKNGAAAITLLRLAGRLTAAIPTLDEGQRRWARDHRTLLVQSAGQVLAEALGGPPAYGIAGGPKDGSTIDVGEESRTWLMSHSSPWHASAADEGQDERQIELLSRSLALLRLTAPASDDRGREIASTLVRSVIRPLCDAPFGSSPSEAGPDICATAIWSRAFSAPITSGAVEGCLVDLALDLVHDRSRREAACGVLRLVASGPLRDDPRLVGGTKALSEHAPSLTVSADGPYLFEGAAEFVNHLGVSLKIGARAAFCRCGQSALKPFCDGSHATGGFSGDKDARRIADVRDIYVGQQATIFDNRGQCAHSGLCTDRLNSVFHLGEEPFVTPSGGRLDDIMRAVRRCPSGALGFGLIQVELRDYVDEARPPAIEISKDGPYRITGAIALNDARDVPVARTPGASAEHYSLCRCGSSLNKPFCSGMHWSIKFVDPRPPADWEPTLFEWAGGYPALLEMTRIFYSQHVPSDPLIGPLFAKMEPDHPERVAAWLSEVFGGPKFYSERYGGYVRMISQHLDKHLTQEQRSHWATLMAQSADEAGLPNDAEFRAAFVGYIEWGSRIAVENSTKGAKPPPNMPMPRWWWVCNAMPNARVSALAAQGEPPTEVKVPILAADERPSFSAHIKDLFRVTDRTAMKFAFDLGSYEDVRKHADAILGRVRAGTMPCDKAWAPEKVALFQRWVEEGSPE